MAFVLMGLYLLCFLVISSVETIAGAMFPGYHDPNAEVSSPLEMNFIYAVLGIGVGGFLVYLPLVITVMIFLYRANANLRAAGTKGLEFTPGWCAGWWFIPIMNLFRPYYATKEIYLASQAQQSGTSTWSQSPAPGVLSGWWGCWLIGSFLTQIESRLALKGVDIGSGGANALSWGGTIFTIVAGVLLLQILSRISVSQKSRFEGD